MITPSTFAAPTSGATTVLMVARLAPTHTVRAAPVKVARKRSEIRPPTSAAARITRATPPAIRTGRLPATRAASEPRPRAAMSAILHTDRFRNAVLHRHALDPDVQQSDEGQAEEGARNKGDHGGGQAVEGSLQY